MTWCFLSLEEILSAETTFQFKFFWADQGQLRVHSLFSNPSPSVELLAALSMVWDLLFMGLVLWKVQSLCHTSGGAKAVLYCNPLAENMMVSRFSAMENQSRKFAVEIIKKTPKTTESGWDIVNCLVAACTVLCSRFVANTTMITQLSCLSCWTVFSQHPGLLYFSCCHPSEGAGGGQDVERGQNKADELSYQGDIPHRIMPQAEMKQSKEEGV